MDEANIRRFRSLRRRTRDLLAGGEQSHVEYKTSVPSTIANQAAAGANLVALNPSIEVYTILLGVEEQMLPNGATRGRVVGCLTTGGPIQDLDRLRLQVEQKIRDAVVPPPRVTITEENVGSPTPILVVEIRPSDPPHRVGDRYQVRGVAGLQPLTQHDAELIFRNKRTGAWIDELENSNPLLAALSSLQESYADLAFRVSDTATTYEDESPFEAVHAVIERLNEIQDDIGNVQSDIDRLVDSVSDIDARTDELVSLSAEGLWHELRKRREMYWHQVNHYAAFGDYADEDLTLIERMIHEHFGAEPAVAEYPANLAESHGYDLTFPVESQSRAHLEVLARFVSAGIARAQGVPGRFSTDWIAQGIASRTELQFIRDEVTDGSPVRRRRPRKPVQREIGILQLSPEGAQALADHRLASTSRDSAAIIWRTDQGAITAARRPKGWTMPIMYRPTWGSDAARRRSPRTGAVGTEFRKVVNGFGGRLMLIDGPGAVLGSGATSTSLELEAP